LIRISIKTFNEAFASKNTEESMHGYMKDAFNHQQLEIELNNPDSSFYFAYSENELIGFFKMNYGTAQVESFQEKTVELGRLYVLKEYQNKKFGEQMLQKAIELGKEAEAVYIWLGVWERNPEAIRFYERHEFKHFGQHPFFMGTEEQTDLLYRLYLNY
jgi:ribosomal protein S18 acetylase RimI-like enzyme